MNIEIMRREIYISFCATNLTNGPEESCSQVNVIPVIKRPSSALKKQSLVTRWNHIFLVLGWMLVCNILTVTGSTNIDLALFISTSGFQMSGSAAGNNLGYSVSGAGDVNGDGVDDILIGGHMAIAFPGETSGGIVYVVFGNKTAGSLPNLGMGAFETGPGTGFRIRGRTDMMVGYRSSRAGDIDADGHDDFMVSAPGATPPGGKTSAGISFVIFGRKVLSSTNAFTDMDMSSFTTGSVGFRILGAAAGDESGNGLSAAGDVNGDGVDDILVGAHQATYADRNTCGIVYVIFGRFRTGGASSYTVDVDLATMSFSTGYRMYGAYAGDDIGRAISSAGDLNGDGIDDILIGASFLDAGKVYIIYGHADSGNIDLRDAPGAGLGITVSGYENYGWFGYSVAGLGDVNGDGLSDIIMGAPLTDTGPNLEDAGMSVVLFGRNVSAGANTFTNIQSVHWVTNATNGFRIFGAKLADYSGWSVGGGGDVNGDGVNDILIGAYGADLTNRNDAGAVYVVFGRKTSVAGSVTDVYLFNMFAGVMDGIVVYGAVATDFLSKYALEIAGDINHDGVDDIIIGAYMASPPGKVEAGIGYVVYGIPDTPTSQPSRQPSSQPSRQPSRQPTRQPTRQPSAQPSRQPSTQPSRQPSSQPSLQPGSAPSARPSCQPTSQPSIQPTKQPLGCPSSQPSAQPSNQPSGQPSGQPSRQPSQQPTASPSRQPLGQPTVQPTQQPSELPSTQPSRQPSTQPSLQPVAQPSGQPLSQPTGQPTMQPSVNPSRQPSGQPTTQPGTRPTGYPSSQPSLQPSCIPSQQPSAQPSSRPTLTPSTQPTASPTVQPGASPSTQPSSLPTNQPSRQPTNQPSMQPSTQPSCGPISGPSSQPSVAPSGQPTFRPSSSPSSQPSAQPSIEPSSRPSEQPTAYPTSPINGQPITRPSVQPSRQPSLKPSIQPTRQPSATPTALPTALPSVVPSFSPNGEWTVELTSVNNVHSMLRVGDSVWVCTASAGLCVTLGVVLGDNRAAYAFPWDTTVHIEPHSGGTGVTVSGRSATGLSAESMIARCEYQSIEQLDCTVLTYAGVFWVSASANTDFNKVVHIGSTISAAAATIFDTTTNTAASYVYTSYLLKTTNFQCVQSIPNFVGSFVAGTCVTNTVVPQNCIFTGWLRIDKGTMDAMYLTPVSGTIRNTALLVTSLAVEANGPDSFIAGGLELNGVEGVHAYLVRMNTLYRTVKYGMRYRINVTPDSTASGNRRTLSETTIIQSAVSATLLLNNNLFMVINYNNSNDISSVAFLNINAINGGIVKQVYLASANLQCSEITESGLFLAVACTIQNSNISTSVLLSVNRDLSFTKLPAGFIKHQNHVASLQSVPFRATVLTMSTQSIPIAVTSRQQVISDERPVEPTAAPSVLSSLRPSTQPSSAPSGQPSSSPTSAPSISPQPTSHPSTGGPTNTFKPTVKPTPRPSAAPSRVPSASPTVKPSVTPTARPTLKPSAKPTAPPSPLTTAVPSIAPLVVPTKAPITKPTTRPISLRTGAPTCKPTGFNNTDLVIEVHKHTRRGTEATAAGVIAAGAVVGAGLLFLLLCTWCQYRRVENKKKKKATQRNSNAAEVIAAEVDDSDFSVNLSSLHSSELSEMSISEHNSNSVVVVLLTQRRSV